MKSEDARTTLSDWCGSGDSWSARAFSSWHMHSAKSRSGAVFTARDRREFDSRVKSDLLIPYLEIPLGGQGTVPLREVYFFPSKNPKEKAKPLRMLLSKYGVPDWEVKTSGIPLL